MSFEIQHKCDNPTCRKTFSIPGGQYTQPSRDLTHKLPRGWFAIVTERIVDRQSDEPIFSHAACSTECLTSVLATHAARIVEQARGQLDGQEPFAFRTHVFCDQPTVP